VNGEVLKVLKLSLGIRKYSPRLELFRSLAGGGVAAGAYTLPLSSST